MAALSGDAARQPEAVKAAFAAGIESQLAALDQGEDAVQTAALRALKIDLMARAVGAIMLSRACPDDSPLAADPAWYAAEGMRAQHAALRRLSDRPCQCGQGIRTAHVENLIGQR